MKYENDTDVPKWFMPRDFIVKLIKEKFPQDKNEAFLELKNELIDFIRISNGNKELVLKHIKWLEDNGYFHWEKDDDVDKGTAFTDKVKEYYFENGRLYQNFTKERFNKVIELFKICKERKNIN